MSNEGIYGTIIEIESLSRFCQLPIAIYYKLDQQGSDANPQPARIGIGIRCTHRFVPSLLKLYLCIALL